MKGRDHLERVGCHNYETGNHGKGRDLVSFGSVQVLWPSAVNMLCFEDNEAFEILLALDFYLCNIYTQSLQASDRTAAYLLYVFCIAISTCSSSGIIRYSDSESVFIYSRLFYFLENTKKNGEAAADPASFRIVE
jgi:hypothetical protein